MTQSGMLTAVTLIVAKADDADFRIFEYKCFLRPVLYDLYWLCHFSKANTPSIILSDKIGENLDIALTDL